MSSDKVYEIAYTASGPELQAEIERDCEGAGSVVAIIASSILPGQVVGRLRLKCIYDPVFRIEPKKEGDGK